VTEIQLIEFFVLKSEVGAISVFERAVYFHLTFLNKKTSPVSDEVFE